jgi:hypothetical protein
MRNTQACLLLAGQEDLRNRHEKELKMRNMWQRNPSFVLGEYARIQSMSSREKDEKLAWIVAVISAMVELGYFHSPFLWTWR